VAAAVSGTILNVNNRSSESEEKVMGRPVADADGKYPELCQHELNAICEVQD